MDIAELTFHRPWLGLLATLLALAGILFVLRRWHLPRLTRVRRVVAWAGLALVALAIGVFVADATIPKEKSGRAWAIVVDRSASSLPAAKVALKRVYAELLAMAEPNDQIAIVAYHREVSIISRWKTPAESPKEILLTSGGDAAGGNVPAAALEFIQATAPRKLDLRVILLSDGGGMNDLEALPPASIVVPLSFAVQKDVALRDMRVRAHLSEGRAEAAKTAIGGEVEIWANVKADATLIIRAEGETIQRLPLKLNKGLLALPLSFDVTKRPPFNVELEIECALDTISGNEKLNQIVPRQDDLFEILIIDQSPNGGESRHLMQALAGSDFNLQVMAPESLPDNADWYDRWDAIMIADASGPQIDVRRQNALAAWVQAGGGLAMLGSPNTFGIGGWLGAPLEKILPVNCDPNFEDRGDRAFVIVMDVSGSMGATLGDGSQKIDHANNGAVLTLRMIAEDDAFGAIASGSDQDWIVPLADLENRTKVEQKLRGNAAGGGGIYIDAGLDTALSRLRTAKQSKRYMLIFGDGSDTTLTGNDSPEARKAWLAKVAPQLKDAGVAVSCVSIGAGGDSEFMKSLATANRGRFFETENAENIPLLFSAAAADMIGGFFQEGMVSVEVTNDGDLARGLPWQDVPILEGLIATTAKEDAIIWLSGSLDNDFPLLATRREGLGRTLAFTSDATDRWAVHWLSWGGYSRAWQRWTRWLAEGAGWQGAARITIDEKEQLLIEHRDVGSADVFALFRDQQGNTSEAILDREGPMQSIWRLPRAAQNAGRFVFWTQNAHGERTPIGETTVHRVEIGEGWQVQAESQALQKLVANAHAFQTPEVSPTFTEDSPLLTSRMLTTPLRQRRVRASWPAMGLAISALLLLLFARRFPAFFRDEGSEKNLEAVATMRRLAAKPRLTPRLDASQRAAIKAATKAATKAKSAPSEKPSGLDFDRLRRAKEARRSDDE